MYTGRVLKKQQVSERRAVGVTVASELWSDLREGIELSLYLSNGKVLVFRSRWDVSIEATLYPGDSDVGVKVPMLKDAVAMVPNGAKYVEQFEERRRQRWAERDDVPYEDPNEEGKAALWGNL